MAQTTVAKTDHSLTHVTINQAMDIIKLTHKMNLANPSQRQAIWLWGAPGMGKTKLTQKSAEDLKIGYKALIAAYYEPTEIKGFPYIGEDEHGKYTGFANLRGVLPHLNEEGILHIDEPNRAPTLTQNVFMELGQEYSINGGTYVLPDKYTIVFSANNEGDGGGIQRTPLALCNRVVHLHVSISTDEWCDWAIANGVHPMVVAFHRWRKSVSKDQLLHNFNGASKDKSFPTPRSWHIVSKYVHANIKNDNIKMACYSGAVGTAAALEFYGFEKFFNEVPSIDEIMLDPTRAKIPTNPSGVYAVCASLAAHMTPGNFGQITLYLDRLPTEFNVMTVRDARRKDEKIGRCPAFTEWGSKHKDVLF